jgi:hypothetical protein
MFGLSRTGWIQVRNRLAIALLIMMAGGQEFILQDAEKRSGLA